MQRDGRSFDHGTLESIRLMAVERVREGERASSVISSYGFNRTTIYKWLTVAHSGLQSGQGVEGFAFTARDWSSTLVDAAPGKASVCLGQRQRSTPVWFGFRSVDTGHDRQPDRAEVCRATGPYGGWRTALQAETYPAETS